MKNAFKFFQYAYLIFAIIFFYNAYAGYNEGGINSAIAPLLLGAAAVFMFFFKKRFGKRFEK